MFLLTLIVYLTFVGCEEIVQVQIITRHGDRTPTNSQLFPNCDVDICKILNLGHGDLTAIGEHQCFLLGQQLRDRYISEGSSYRVKDISPHYESGEYKFYSSSTDRTLQSAFSFSMGLFQGVGSKLDIYPYTFALPNGSTPIPYPTLEEQNDRIFYEYDNCAVLDFRLVEFFLSEEGIDYVYQYLPTTEKLGDISGWVAPLPAISGPSDLAHILNDHQLLCEPIIPLLEEYKKLYAALNRVLYKRSIVGNLVGGALMTQILDNFDGGVKFAHFSGHDSTILNALYAIYAFEDHERMYRNPPFAAALVFEKVLVNGTEYIMVLYQTDVSEGLRSFPLKTLGCGNSSTSDLCEYEEFKRLVNEKSMVGNSQWCSECLNDTDEKCLHFYLEKALKQINGDKNTGKL